MKKAAKAKSKAKPAAKKITARTRRPAKKAPPPRLERRPSTNVMQSLLLKMRRNLLEDIARNRGQEIEVAKVDIGDDYDISSQNRDRDLILTLNDMERSKLAEIDDALLKIKDRTYGTCEECGEKIPPGRLLALPFTKVCVDCKSKLERDERMKKVLEEEEVSQTLVIPETEEEET